MVTQNNTQERLPGDKVPHDPKLMERLKSDAEDELRSYGTAGDIVCFKERLPLGNELLASKAQFYHTVLLKYLLDEVDHETGPNAAEAYTKYPSHFVEESLAEFCAVGSVGHNAMNDIISSITQHILRNIGSAVVQHCVVKDEGADSLRNHLADPDLPVDPIEVAEHLYRLGDGEVFDEYRPTL